MSRRLFHGVVVLLIALIGMGPACACAARGFMPAAPAPAPRAEPMAGEHACCHSPNAKNKTTDVPHDQSCPLCQAMTVSVKAVPDQQSAPAWASLHLMALAPAALAGAPAVGAIHVAVFSPVWSPPPLLNDLFHTFCLLTL